MEEKKESKKTAAKKSTAKKVSSTKTTTKKTTTKPKEKATKKSVEKKEEVGSFCPNCGKKLQPGEKCDCQSKKNMEINIDKDAIIEKGRGLLETVISIYKNPYGVCKEVSSNKEIKNGIILIIFLALSLGFLISSVTYAAFHVKVNSFEAVPAYYEVSYFKVFVVWSFVSFIMAFLPIVISHLAGALFSKEKFDFKFALNLYAHAMSVAIFANVIAAIFILAGLFIKFFLMISLIAMVLGYINYIFLYRDLMNFEKEKEAYIFLGIIIVWALGMAIVTSLFVSGVDGFNAYDTIISTINR